jgi:hypothetical protein
MFILSQSKALDCQGVAPFGALHSGTETARERTFSYSS